MTIYNKDKWKRLATIGVTAGLWCMVPLGLAAILLFLVPALLRETESARRNVCANRLREIAQAIRQYRDVFGDWPPVYTVDDQGKPLHSWRVLILPYLNKDSNLRLYHSIRLKEPWDSPFNSQFHNSMPSVYHCPSIRTPINRTNTTPNNTIETVTSDRYSTNNYCSYFIVASERTFSVAETTNRTTQSVSTPTNSVAINDSGLSNRILIVEQREAVNWMTPDKEPNYETACRGINSNVGGLGSFHPGGMNVAMVDGSVRFLSDVINPNVLQTMLIGTYK